MSTSGTHDDFMELVTSSDMLVIGVGVAPRHLASILGIL